jgi:multiple sugar transport system ATP-binding protein
MAGVTLKGVTKEYDNGFTAVEDLDLDIEDGEFLVMVGPSGCGKSTTLRMIAGLEEITEGELRIGERLVNDVHPKDRDIAMVFQNYALYPHMSVADNIGFALKLAKNSKAEIAERVGEAARLLELTEQLDKKPGQLSGGQRQRVAMGRAIVRRPQVFLLDEPLSNLDAKLRVQMRAEITDLQRNVGVTTFYVTHDQVEAMTMADRVAVINAGILQQVAAPQTLFDHPDNLFVAAFIGSPSMNLLEGIVTESGGAYSLQLGSQTVELPTSLMDTRPALRDHIGNTIVAGIRPKDFEDAAIVPGHPVGQRIRATIENVEALGYERIVYFGLDAKQVIQEDAMDLKDDTEVLQHHGGSRISGRFDPASTVQAGEEVEVAVSAEETHFFDPESGLAIRT